MPIQLFSSISVNSGFWNIHLHASQVGEYSVAIHLDFREQLLIIRLLLLVSCLMPLNGSNRIEKKTVDNTTKQN